MSIKPISTYSSHYERMSGNCTRILASQIIKDISPPITASSYVLDNACGPGIVTEQMRHSNLAAKVMATDLSFSMIEEVKQSIKNGGWNDIETNVLDSRHLDSIQDDTFSHVITNFGMPVPDDPEGSQKIVEEVFRVLAPDGVAVFSTWADRVWLNAFYNAGRAIKPTEAPQTLMALKPDELRGSWLVAQLENGGFRNNVELKPCMTYTTATSLDELVNNMMLASMMFFKGFNENELRQVKIVFKEELKRLRTYEAIEGGVRIGMKAWLGIGRKLGDEKEVPV